MVNDERAKEHRTRWSCLFYGSYLANEVVGEAFDAVDPYAVEEGDLIIDATLYSKLSAADWDGNDDTVVDGKRYHRLCAADAVTASGDRSDLLAMSMIEQEPEVDPRAVRQQFRFT